MITTDGATPTPPVTREDFRAHLRLSTGFAEDAAEDALLDRYLETATAQIELQTAQVLVARPVTLALAGWTAEGHAILPVGPVAAIARFELTGQGAPVMKDPARLAVGPGRTRQRVTLAGGLPLPPIPQGMRAELGFTAGYGGGGLTLPADLRQAVLILAAHRFERRDGTDAPGLPAGVAALIAPHRPVRL